MIIVDMTMAAIAGSCAVCFTNPFDLTKTRLQLDGESARAGQKRLYRGWKDCISANYQAGGLRALNQGLSFAVMREAVLNCFRLGLYGPILQVMTPSSPALAADFNPSEMPPTPFWVKVASGMVSGLIGGALANPLEVLKVRMHASSNGGGLASGHQHGYRNSWHAVHTLVQKEGFKGMWTGLTTSCVRMMIASGVQLPTYYITKSFLVSRSCNEDAPSTHIASSMVSAAAAISANNPIDVCRTRLYNQPRNADGTGKLYSGGMDAAVKIYRNEGPLAFYKGGLTNMFRLGPHLTLVFVILEKLRMIARNNGHL
uniref:Uncharacterized protein n=1 Tax=Fibrocapsa japonica TaxID=94617 RepID=A0A7S2XYW3_9STRA|mmetsp:Transcript_4223/g.6304  ORF Transcript_4223/g.6304 Transcript_4223/m.6304 type:complete len:314 (+) Transcript_4223:106-1047(+)|eukprot:CAMPEP_0113942314 /NCGR_PEP_ID=MMETSP1339-20121228/8048_1 /TAXON_ID=94617 /ORGANISM="Fibrocapsa japonica" /LENGTH=313 /DNA_ID=CAMNT_0000946731 /DNA_START=112 /DNA_END=1053 /DNA_ORIENTATION=+ /assembly_acc=CAM_ASM_000762